MNMDASLSGLFMLIEEEYDDEVFVGCAWRETVHLELAHPFFLTYPILLLRITSS